MLRSDSVPLAVNWSPAYCARRPVKSACERAILQAETWNCDPS
jgi:ribonuclease I